MVKLIGLLLSLLMLGVPVVIAADDPSTEDLYGNIESEWVPEVERYRRLETSPEVVAQQAVQETRLPPPDGVIVLRPRGIREEAESCPEHFREVTKANGWRFCLDRQRPEIIPRLWSPSFEAPIAGIPYEEAQAIYERHLVEFVQLPGVTGGGLGAQGITIETSQPELVPPDVEGLPIFTAPPTRFSAGGTQPLRRSVKPDKIDE